MAGIDLTGPRRSELLSALLQKQLQPQQNIRSGGELGARLLAQLLQQKKIDKLRGDEAQAETQSQRRIADALAGTQGRQNIDLQGVDGAEILNIPEKRGAEGAQRQGARLAGMTPDEVLAAQTLQAGQRDLADPSAFQQKEILQGREFEAAESRLDKTIVAEERRDERRRIAQETRDAKSFAQRDKELFANLSADEAQQVRGIQAQFVRQSREIEARQKELAAKPKGSHKATEWAAAGYGVRMFKSSAVIDEVGEKFTGFESRLVGAVPQGLRFADRQRFEQAKRDFINAKLRDESGAVISDQEFANAEQQYFPQPGNGPEVLAQKAENRRVVIAAMRLESNGAFELLQEDLDNAPQSAPSPGPEEGATATGPNGEKAVFAGGKWVVQ